MSQLLALTCTGDPVLDSLLRQCKSLRLAPQTAETVTDAIRLAGTLQPQVIFVSPAVTGAQRLAQAVPGARLILLVDLLWGVPPSDAPCEVLAAEHLTAREVDAWLRKPPQPAAQVTPSLKAGHFPVPSHLKKVMPGPPVAESAASAASALFPKQPAGRPPSGAGPSAPARPAPDGQGYNVLRQQLIALWGGKPGAGRSTIAVALSDLLSRIGPVKVCTVDLNPYNSSLAPLVAKEQEPSSWFHLAQGPAAPVQEALRWVSPNWAVLTGPDGQPDWVALMDPGVIQSVVDRLRSQFDYIILDLEARPGPLSEAALRLAQTVMVVVSPDYPDLLDSKRAYERVVDAGILTPERCRLILSRWVETPHLSSAVVSGGFGLPVSVRIPAAPEALAEASGQSRPVTRVDSAGARPVNEALATLLQLVASNVGQTSRTGVRSWFGR